MDALTETQREKLSTDLKNVIHDAEELLKMTASDVGTEATEMRERIRGRLVRAKESLLSLQESAVERAKRAGHHADEYVHQHPWQSIGIAAGVGALLGVLISRR